MRLTQLLAMTVRPPLCQRGRALTHVRHRPAVALQSALGLRVRKLLQLPVVSNIHVFCDVVCLAIIITIFEKF